MLQVQKNLYGQNILEELLRQDQKLLSRIEAVSPLTPHPDAFATKEWYYANFYLYRKVTAYERMDIVTMLSEKFFGLQTESQRLK